MKSLRIASSGLHSPPILRSRWLIMTPRPWRTSCVAANALTVHVLRLPITRTAAALTRAAAFAGRRGSTSTLASAYRSRRRVQLALQPRPVDCRAVPKVLDPARRGPKAGRVAWRAHADACRHGSGLLVLIAVLRGPTARTRLGGLPRRFSAPSADGRRPHLRRLRPRRPKRRWRSTHGQPSMASTDGGTRRQREVGFSFRRAGVGGQVDACRNSMAAVHPTKAGGARSFLAVRRVGNSCWPVRRRRGLRSDVERELRPRGAYRRSARRL